MRRHWSLERTGAAVLVALTLLTVSIVAVSGQLRVAADDMYAAVAEARGNTDVPARPAYGRWLATLLASDVPSGEINALKARADVLSYRSDRLREAAAVPAVVGLLAALLTDAPDPTGARRAASQPVANTSSNGTA